jgi:hypothetical protein
MRRRPHSRCRRERCGAITVAKTRAKAFGVSATSRETRVEVPSKSKRAGRRRRSGSSDEVSKRIVPRWRTLKRLYMSRSRRFSSKFPRGVDLTKFASSISLKGVGRLVRVGYFNASATTVCSDRGACESICSASIIRIILTVIIKLT